MFNHFYQTCLSKMYRRWADMRFISVLLVLPVIVGCAVQSQANGTAPPGATESPPASVVPSTTPLPASPTSRVSTVTATTISTTAPSQTDTAIPPTNVVTPEVIPPDELMTPDTERYSIVVTYTLDRDFPEEYPQPPAGKKWLVVVATLTNVSSAPITLDDTALTLVDADGQEYIPEQPDEFTTPPLVGATVKANTSHIGLLRYGVPQTVEPSELIWCLQSEDGVCVNSVSTRIP